MLVQYRPAVSVQQRAPLGGHERRAGSLQGVGQEFAEQPGDLPGVLRDLRVDTAHERGRLPGHQPLDFALRCPVSLRDPGDPGLVGQPGRRPGLFVLAPQQRLDFDGQHRQGESVHPAQFGSALEPAEVLESAEVPARARCHERRGLAGLLCPNH